MMTEPIPQEEKSTMSNGTKTEFKTVAVLGGAYGGEERVVLSLSRIRSTCCRSLCREVSQ